jgi:hypothetical protein
MRINGIGTAYLGLGPRDGTDCRCATLWFTFLFLPVKPLRRHRLRLTRTSHGVVVEPIAETPLVPIEICRTRLYGFLIFPLLIAWPLPLAIFSIGGLEKGEASWIWPATFFASLGWLIGSPLLLMRWHEGRTRPRSTIERARDAHAQ